MGNIGLTKNYKAGGAIPARTLVKFGADEKTVVAAAAATDSVIGVTTDIDAALNDPVDVQLQGIAIVKAGGAITRGGFVASDANGNGVTPAPAAGANNRVVGIAMQDAVLNDLFDVFLRQGTLQG
jgi:hypothetical protein